MTQDGGQRGNQGKKVHEGCVEHMCAPQDTEMCEWSRVPTEQGKWLIKIPCRKNAGNLKILHYTQGISI